MMRTTPRTLSPLLFLGLGLAAAACNPNMFKMPSFGGGNTSSAATGGKVVSSLPTEDQEVVVHQLTSLTENASAPSLSYDGSLLLFLQADGIDPKTKKKTFSLMGVDPSASAAPSEFTQDGVSALDPSFFPDASGFVFVSDSMGPLSVVRTESMKAGASASVVAQSFSEPRSPSVSPDGTRIMFSAKVKGQDVIVTVKPDGTMKSVLGPGRKARYSPDGAKAVFVKPGKNNHAQLFTMSAQNGKGVTQVLSGDAEDDSPSFSPDGQYISFVSSRSGSEASTRNVFIVRTDGTGLKQLTRGNGAVSDAFWGRDGKVYFAADPEKSGHTNIFVASMPKIMGSFIDAPAQASAPQQEAKNQPQAPAQAGQSGGWLQALIPGQASAQQSESQPQQPAPTQNTCATSTCGSAEACPNLPCICNNGKIVNTRACNNACCAPANVACTNSCTRFGGFSGNLSGSGGSQQTEQASSPAPAPAQQTKAAFSKSCRQDRDCESNACLFKGRASMGYCTKECTSFSECPFQWECKNVRNGSSKYCVQDAD
jgi:Tol biopolymer transport system component